MKIGRTRWIVSRLGVAAAASLAGCGGGDNCESCYVGSGSGGSGSGTNYASDVSYGLVVGDFGGNALGSSVIETSAPDGRAPNAGQLNIYLATGPSSYAAPTAVATGNQPLYLASADFDRNGLPDVVSANSQDGELEVFLNGSGGTPGVFATPLVLDSPGASQLAVADMNGDGLPDIVSADFNVSLFEQTTPGVFANPISLYSGGANWVAVGDLDHDGISDVALVDGAGVRLVFHTGSAGANTYSAATLIYQESSDVAAVGANVVAIADVNGDGYDDLIITDPGPAGGNSPFVSIMLQNPASPGTFAAPVSYATAPGSQAYSILVQDIDGDGLPDIIIGGSTAVSVLVNQPGATGTFYAADNYAASDTFQIAIADVNGDGLPDIVTTTGVSHTLSNGAYQNEPGVLLQNPSNVGFFTALQDLP